MFALFLCEPKRGWSVERVNYLDRIAEIKLLSIIWLMRSDVISITFTQT